MKNKLYTKGSANRFSRWTLLTICFMLSLFTAKESRAVPLAGPYAIPGAYADLGTALADLNLNGVSAAVTFTLGAGQVAPAGGYIIGGTGSPLLTTTSALNTVTINGAGNSITAFSPQTVGALNDGIINLVGADFITITGCTFVENAGNVVTVAASNTMTEWAIGLFYVSTTDGARNNTITLNNISLTRTYQNAFGIFSTTRTTLAAPLVAAEIAGESGSNSNNTVSFNAISNTSYGVAFIGCGAVTATGAQDHNNTIVNNTLTNNQGIGVTPSAFIGLTGNYPAIYMLNQYDNEISFNDVTSALGTTTGGGSLEGIRSNYSATTANPLAINPWFTKINNNRITINNAPQSGGTGGLNSIQVGANLLANVAASLTVENNICENGSITGPFCINNTMRVIACAGNWNVVNANNNTIRGCLTNTQGGQFQGVLVTGSPIKDAFIKDNKLGDGATPCITYLRKAATVMFCVTNIGAGVATMDLTMTGNDIRGFIFNDTCTSTHLYYDNQATSARNTTISNNTLTNLSVPLTGQSVIINNISNRPANSVHFVNNNSIVGAYTITTSHGGIFIYGDAATAPSSVTETNSGNNYSNITWPGGTMGGWQMTQGTAAGGPVKIVTNNVFNNITSTLNGNMQAIIDIGNMSAGSVISGNTITNISSQGGSIAALRATAGSATISGNTISSLTTTGVFATGITIFTGTSIDVKKNKICNIQADNAAGVATGILVSGVLSAEISNNIIGDLRAPSTNTGVGLINAVVGIDVNVKSSAHVYNNTVYLDGTGNASSADWGSSAFSIVPDTAFQLNNNVLINNSTAKGSGLAVSFSANGLRATLLANYDATSNNNDFFGSTLYKDQTGPIAGLVAYQALVGPRDATSFSQYFPGLFISTTCGNADFLHVIPVASAIATKLESGGTNIVGVTDDFDNQTRFGNPGYVNDVTDPATAPDVGADEFVGIKQGNCFGTPAAGTISGITSICDGASTTLSLVGANSDIGVSYQWKSGTVSGGPYGTLGGTATLEPVGPIVHPSTTYYVVTVTCSFSGLSSTTAVQHTLASNPLPTVNVTPTSAAFCLPTVTPVALTASGSPANYAWKPTAGLSASTGANTNALPEFSTTYVVTGTDANGCSATASAAIGVSNTPASLVATATPSAVCTGNTSTLDVQGSITLPSASSVYTFAASAGVYVPLSGVDTVQVRNLENDDANSIVPIGFDFKYEGITKSLISASSNGFASFNTSGSGFNNLLSTGGFRAVVAPLWDDLSGVDPNVPAEHGTASYETAGLSGNRIFTFEWSKWYWDFNNSDSVISFQLKLYEVDNHIEFIYKDETGVPSAASATIGINGATLGNFLSLNNSGPAPVASSLNETQSISIEPATGQVYSFTPPIPAPTYAWVASAGPAVPAVQSPLVTPVAGITSYTVTVTNNGCTASAVTSVNSGSTLTCTAATVTGNACAGSDFTITANHTGGGAPFTYVWSDGAGGVYPGTATVTANLPAGSYNFDCLVTDPCGGSCNSTFIVTVNAAPSAVITEGPAVQSCSPAVLTLNATTNFGTSYQWKKDGTAIPLATNPSLIVTASGNYTVLISDGTCSSESAVTVATLVTTAVLPVNLSPSNILGCFGASTSANFSGFCAETNTITTSVTTPSDTSWAAFMQGTMLMTVAGFPAGAVITDVSLTLGIAHDKAGELSVTLTSPTSPAKLILNGPATNLPSTFGTNGSVPTLPYTFTSSSTTVIPASGAIPSPGPYKAFDALTFFHGLTPNGVWAINILDIGQPGGGGTVDNVSLTISAVSPSGPVVWYNVPVAGVALATTSSFNPITDGGATTGTAGQVFDFYAECNSSPIGGCPGGRTHVTFTVGANPDDGDPCTLDACDPGTGIITNTPNCAVELSSNIQLQGFYTGGGTMTPEMNNVGVSPNPLVVDVITISAMDAGYPTGPNGTTPVDVQVDTLYTDGSINVTFGAAVVQGTAYYLKVNHRNSLEIWTPSAIVLGATNTYLFSSGVAQALNGTQASSGDGFALVYTGDITQDLSIDASDFLAMDPEIQAGLFGYFLGDLTGEGSVDASDFLALDPNIQLGITGGTP